MKKTHFKKLMNKNYIGAFSLDEGQDLILTIKTAAKETFKSSDGSDDEGLVIRFVEDVKPFICNKTNAETISKLAKSDYIEDWEGLKIQFYAAQVTAFGKTGDALRIRDFRPKQEAYYCKKCGVEISAFGKLSNVQVAEQSQKKYGQTLCVECAKEKKAELEEKAKATDILSNGSEVNNG